MTATTTDPVLAVAVRAARRAASVVVDASRDLRRLPSFSKEHGEIATAAKAEAEQAIAATLGAAFPDHAILGDAAAGPPPKAGGGCQWIVDPLDGMMNFVRGYPYFAVSVALSQDNVLTHAVVLDPARDELFTAMRGKGTQINGNPVRTSSCTRLGEALVGTVMPTRRSPRLPRYLPILNALAARCTLRRAGACALDLAYVAAGRLDGFFVLSLGARDVAAGALMVNEAGGRVGDFAGGQDYMRTNEVIAAAPGVFNSLREAIASADLHGGAL